MDRYSYICPARVKVLLVPVNNSLGSAFRQQCLVLRSFSEIRLLDITPIPDLKLFNPQTSPNGRILMDFTTSVPDTESVFLHDFEPYRKTFIVLGLGGYTETMSPQTCDGFNRELKQRYPSSIVHNTIIFDTPTDKIDQFNPKSNHSAKLSFFHTSQVANILSTIMCEISRNFLQRLDECAISYANITLRSPVSISDSQLLAKTISKAQKRISSGMSSVKVSFNSSVSVTPSELKTTAQTIYNGRHLKLRGSFYLLAGNYPKALNQFTEALLYLRKSEDYMWLGSALEGIGIAVILLNYTGIDYQLEGGVLSTVLHLLKNKVRDVNERKLSGESLSRVTSNISTDTTKVTSPRNSSSGLSLNLGSLSSGPDLNTVEVPELVKLINHKVHEYFQLSANDFETVVPDLVYLESTLRHLQFILDIYRHGSVVNHQMFDCIVNGTSNDTKTANPWFNKNNILNELDKIYSLQLMDLSLIDQCRIYCKLASVYNGLKMYRKQAFALRTLLVAILPELKAGPLLDAHPLDDLIAGITNTVSLMDSKVSISAILADLFDVYEVNRQPEVSIADSMGVNRWNGLQLSLIKLAIKVFENLHDHSGLIGIYCVLLTRYIHCLPLDDELKLRDRLHGLGQTHSVPYWDPFLVRDVQYIVNKNQPRLMPFLDSSGTEIGDVVTPALTPTATPTPTAENTPHISAPVIFDPFKKTTASSKDQLVVKDEVCHVKVTLQNPYSFELYINDIDVACTNRITTIKSGGRNHVTASGPDVKTSLEARSNASGKGRDKLGNVNETSLSTATLIIPPKACETFVVPFIPLESGELVIRGFHITVDNCVLRFFPVIDKELVHNDVKLKYSHDNLPNALGSIVVNLTQNRLDNRASSKQLKLVVVDPQPKLVLTQLLVTNGWFMLLEGERYKFSVTLTNRSQQPINYLSFSFWDSTIVSLDKKLSMPNLSALEVYDLEWYLLKSKSFRILNKQEINDKYKPINGNEEIQIHYEIIGKNAMVDLKMILEYGNKLLDLAKSFLQTIEIPLHMTVMPCIEVVHFDVFPLYPGVIDSAGSGNYCNLDLFRSFVGDVDTADYCLMVVDLRNAWRDEVAVDVAFAPTAFKIKDVLKPATTARYLVPVKRFARNHVDVTRRIPSLRHKQYVKDYLLTKQQDLEMRRHFWIREDLLGRITGVWTTSGKTGDIDFRSVRLTPRMINCMVYPPIEITYELINEESGQVVDGREVLLELDTFYTVATTIANIDDVEIKGWLTHVPALLNRDNVDKKMMVNGVLRSPVEVGARGTGEWRTSFVVLERGEFEWGSILEVASGSELVVSQTPLYFKTV